MKKIILLLTLLISGFQYSQAQDQGNRLLIEEYVQQSENQKRTGLAMVIAGSAAMGIGYLIAINASLDDTDFATGSFLLLGGGASILIGIPILISSGVKARRSAELSLQATKIQNPLIPGSNSKVFPSIGISISPNTKKP